LSQLSWIRFEVGLPRNPKILALLGTKDGYPAAWLYVCGLAYAGEHGTDGWIPADAVPTMGGCYAGRYAGRYAELLVLHGLWDLQPGGWLVHDWHDFQATSDEARARSERARAAARARWNGHQARSPAERQADYRRRKVGPW
jgi:hypothetical protein